MPPAWAMFGEASGLHVATGRTIRPDRDEVILFRRYNTGSVSEQYDMSETEARALAALLLAAADYLRVNG